MEISSRPSLDEPFESFEHIDIIYRPLESKLDNEDRTYPRNESYLEYLPDIQIIVNPAVFNSQEETANEQAILSGKKENIMTTHKTKELVTIHSTYGASLWT